MDERLSRSNRLPGSEKLTRPEEIGQLSKYLKSIKEVYEESTRLEDQVLGVTGYSTGKIPEINSLGDKSVKAPENQGETPDLSQKILGVPGKRLEEKLSEKRLNLKDPRTPKLENEVIKTPDNHGGEVSRLEEVIKKIQDVRNQSLSNKKIDLLDERNIALEDTRLDLQAIINTSLENKRIDLSDNRTQKLEDTKLELTDNRQVKLEDTRLDISDSRDQKLEDKVIGLKEPEEIKLGNKRLDIQDDGVGSLENKRIDLSAEENIELGKKRLNISDKRDPELSDTRLDLIDDRDVELGNKKIELGDDREIELTDKRLNIKDENNPSLSNKIIGLEDDRDSTLSDTRIDLKDDRNTELEDTRLNLTDDRENELGDKRLDITDERENELEDTRIELTDSRVIDLSDKILGLFDEREPELEDTRLDIRDERETSLSDKILGLEDTRKTELEDKKINLEDNREEELEYKRLDLTDSRDTKIDNKVVKILENENGEPEELYDSMLVAPENENGEPTELYDALLGIAENKGGEVTKLGDKIIEGIENQGDEIDELEDKRLDLEDQRDTNLSEKILGVAENKGFAPDLSDIDSLRDYTSSLSDSELYEFAMNLASEGENASGDHDGWMEKVSGLMSAYLSSDILTPKRAIEFRDAINNTLEMSYFGSQAALRVPVDTSSGTTWAKAEEEIPEYITGTNRRDALDEMIVKLVDYKRSNLPSLPGSSLVDASIGALKGLASTVSTLVSGHPNPMNKPLHANGSALPYGLGDSIFQAANSRTQSGSLDPTGDTTMGLFLNRYWSSTSFKTTLEDLCPVLGEAPVASLTDLKSLLKASPYITTPGKFMTDTKGSYNTQTLDTNMYWEVIFEPFCIDSGPCNNGGYSYLPSIREINYENETYHQVKTRYGFWAPINGFELQKSKLVTKSLQLYEGEIVYPTGMEFTNELRLTFVDDSLKSWRRYFEKCAQVAVFNSTPHGKLYYQSPIISSTSGITQIDKNNICIAPYKNLAFNIKIYILSPQLNTLKRYNLLCVLKDFSEEYVGEVDSGGTDLNVSFSIVGENPGENKATNYILLGKDVAESIKKQRKLDIQKTLSNAIRSSIGLL